MTDYSVTQNQIFHNQGYNFAPQNMLPKSYYSNNNLMKSTDTVSINSNKNKSKKKPLLLTIAGIAALALTYTFWIRKLESKDFKEMAKGIKPEEIYLPQLKSITKELTLTSKKGNKINVLDINPNNYDKYIINCNGIDVGISPQEQILRQAKENNYGFIEFNYCGQGSSTGKFNQKGCYESLDTVVNYLKSKGISSENIVLVGHSMGTGVACDYAKNHKVRGLVLIEPFDEFRSAINANIKKVDFLPEFVKKTIQMIPKWMIPLKNKFNNLKALKQIKAKTLLITSKDDEVVTCDLTRNLYEKTKRIGDKKILVFENGGHQITEEKEKAYFQFINELFQQ